MSIQDETLVPRIGSDRRRDQDGPGMRRVAATRFRPRSHPEARTELFSSSPLVVADDSATHWVVEITQVWSRGVGHALELANVLGRARNLLPRGEWTQVLKRLPFSKRKADMLVAIGKKFSWLNAQTFAHLPPGWSVLYQLAQLARADFLTLLQQRAIHPRLTLQEAKALVAKCNGRPRGSGPEKTSLTRRLKQFADFVRTRLSDWRADERDQISKELKRLVAEVEGWTTKDFERSGGGPLASPPHNSRSKPEGTL